jgi:hypothetical protein
MTSLPHKTFSVRYSKQFFILLFLAIAAYGQQERIAIIQTVDDGDSIKFSELVYLTDKLRETAVNVLPESRYGVMTMESIVAFLGSQERMVKECKAASCLAELGRKVSADYVAQARIGRFGKNLTIKTELYSSKSGNLLGSFVGDSKDIFGLLAIINEKAPDLFKKMPGVSGSSKTVSPSVSGGISDLEKASTGYESDYEKRYVVNLSTEPAGAILSFDGKPDSRCMKTPCKAELGEGSIRIIAALEQHETADTTVSIKHNNQNIAIALNSNFGVLEIKPAYSEGIEANKGWSLSINGKPQSSYENRFSPGNYEVKLNHECYEDISFKAGINKGKREVFDMASNITPKKGGLVLSAERNGEPASEPVFVNGKQAGETPFSGTVPICSKVEIGKSREMVDVKLKYNEKVKHTHSFYENKARDSKKSYTPKYESLKPLPEDKQTVWWRNGFTSFGFGILAMSNSIDTLYNSLGGFQAFMNAEFFKPSLSYLHFGLNLNFGFLSIDEAAIKKMYPEVDSTDDAAFVGGSVFVKFYPTDIVYLLGGVGYNHFSRYAGLSKTTGKEVIEFPSTSAVVFPVGAGLVWIWDSHLGFFLDAQYNIALLKNRVGGYWSFNLGMKIANL